MLQRRLKGEEWRRSPKSAASRSRAARSLRRCQRLETIVRNRGLCGARHNPRFSGIASSEEHDRSRPRVVLQTASASRPARRRDRCQLARTAQRERRGESAPAPRDGSAAPSASFGSRWAQRRVAGQGGWRRGTPRRRRVRVGAPPRAPRCCPGPPSPRDRHRLTRGETKEAEGWCFDKLSEGLARSAPGRRAR